ncbi:hypothetical protein IVB08_12230 [Bradyrhizobium sp. 173]|uniref:hypothetical protein n=1 Tax=Bradyrhizobium sp. 173 TaxID=2782644 RepID=UPI001FFABD8C|nr:hypothetical protein [Bradyrhizobium sp. 173]MCK1564711.1 hypothetical protein [Bradyrhizobium sp. 173]
MNKGKLVSKDFRIEPIAERIARPDASTRIHLRRFSADDAQAASFDNALDGPKLDHVLELRMNEQHLLNQTWARDAGPRERPGGAASR